MVLGLRLLGFGVGRKSGWWRVWCGARGVGARAYRGCGCRAWCRGIYGVWGFRFRVLVVWTLGFR